MTGSAEHGGARIVPRDADGLAGAARALVDVHEQDGYPAWWPEDPAGWLTPPAMQAAWVARDDRTVLGHVCVVGDVSEPGVAAVAGVPTARLLSVSRLFTHPAARGLRLGGVLLAAAQQYAAALGRPLVLDVVDDGGPALRLYDRLGWRRVERRPTGWTMPDGRRPDTVVLLAPDLPPAPSA